MECIDRAAEHVGTNIDVVIMELGPDCKRGLDLIRLWKARAERTQFIVHTAHHSLGTAVEAIKAGAYDYLVKTVEPQEMVRVVHRAIVELTP